VRLLHDDVLPFFDATALEVTDEIEVSDGRFSIAVVVSGDGSIEGDFGGQPVRRGETFALPASLPIRVRAQREPVRVVRCLGPAVD
jgi:mannose-6-phosphate isomerase class I